MTSQTEPPVLDQHEHHLEHDHDGDHHDHRLAVIDEPLDPASQSLSDALRASFRVLKVIMLIVIVLFLLSGVYRVDTNERVIISHLGRYLEPKEPGLQIAWPYPIDERITVYIGSQTLPVDTFWFTTTEADRNKEPSELSPRGQGLDPATDGALLTGDHAIMNLKLMVQYRVRVSEVMNYARNVSDAERLLKSVIQDSSIAEAARTRADDLLKAPSELATRIRRRAQQSLDDMQTGIELLVVAAVKSSYPLQTASAFAQVLQEENTKQANIQAAVSEQQKKLNGVAGDAWKALYDQIQKLDQKKDPADQATIHGEIDRLLSEEAKGEASGRIKQAQARKNQIIAETEGRKATFEAILKGYQENPALVRHQQRQAMLTELFSAKGVSKWYLPDGDKLINLIFNQDPVQLREREKQEMQGKVGE